jgi:predicted CxxxxCH...CXXCH cytochrome family protein
MASSLLRRVVSVASIAAAGALLAAGCGTRAPEPAAEGPGAAVSKIAPDLAAASAGACMPTGAHPKHAAYACTVCHLQSGSLCFDPAGPATIAGAPPPSFEVAAKTCSSVACHRVAPGTFVYSFPGGDGEPETRSAPYGSASAPATPSWYATGAGCRACHDLSYGGTRYVWHSGLHGGGNGCALCHLDATGTATPTGPSADSAISTATTCPPNPPPSGTRACSSYHANQVVNVTPKFRTSCFGCH